MALLGSCTGLTKSYGSRLLFENIALGISEGERLGLIGRNGAGKSTLLRILAGQLEPDGGSVSFRRNTRVGYVPQEAEFPESHTVHEVIAAAISGEHLDELARARIGQTLGRARFTDATLRTEALPADGSAVSRSREMPISGVLFLDEPTNHLDFEGIQWLEKLLSSAAFASVVVSRDRYFLDTWSRRGGDRPRLPGGLFRVEGRYSRFLERKGVSVGQSNRQEALANRVQREVEWLRREAKARTGKIEARIDNAGRLMRELGDLETRTAKGVTQDRFHGHRPPQ
jgi:ATP-binding cassette subfamily F protein uup